MLPTSSSARTGLPRARTLALTVCGLLTTGVALAGPAAAVEDPRRPVAEVTHGPSCGPGAVRALVTNGTEPHRVSLVFDGTGEQASAVVGPDEQVELASEDVAWGVTVAVSVTVADLDGTVEDPLELSTYTRPSADDCAAVTDPTTSAPAPTPTATGEPSSSAPVPESTTVPPTSTAPPPSSPEAPAPSTTRTPSGSSPPGTPRPPSPSALPTEDTDHGQQDDDVATGSAGSASAASVSPGGVVTVRATGFVPGEPVTVSIAGLDEPLTTVTAAADGSVEAVVQIPRAAALGTATVRFVGGESSATAGLDLQVAARAQPAAEQAGSPAVVAAGLALIGAAGALGLVGARRSHGRHGTNPR